MLSPVAMPILVLVTLFGALPMHELMAEVAPHGDGSISRLERLLSLPQGNPLIYLMRFILFGEVLRQAEPDPGRRPAIHMG